MQTKTFINFFIFFIFKNKTFIYNIIYFKNYTYKDILGIVGVKMRDKEKKIFTVIFREKPSLMLVTLKNSKSAIYASSLAKNVDCTYSHVVKILQEMQKAELVKFEKQGRLKLLTLTKKGSDIAEGIDKIRNSM